MLQFENLTEAHKAILCNGCGPKGGIGRAVPELFLHEICDRHDFDYWVGGAFMDRWYADWRLLRSGQKLAGWDPAKHSACITYWAAVRLCGALCFHYGRKRNEKDLAKIMEVV